MGANAKAPKLSLNSGTIFCLYWYFFYFAQFSWRCVSCTVNHKWGTDREVSPGQYIHLRPIWLRRIQPRYSFYNIFLPNSVVWSSKLDGLWCQYVTRQNLPRGGGGLRIGTWLLRRCKEKGKQMNSASFPSKMLNPTRNANFCIRPFSFTHMSLFSACPSHKYIRVSYILSNFWIKNLCVKNPGEKQDDKCIVGIAIYTLVGL